MSSLCCLVLFLELFQELWPAQRTFVNEVWVAELKMESEVVILSQKTP